ncbi:hypothetical protein TNCV_3478801 [Trichonephila clavipes]|nr:hypothetical protein TNCV_3478801 [Trichonephila clavipes]
MTNVFRYLTSIAVYSFKFKRRRAAHVVTPHMNITYRQTSGLGIVSNDMGNIWPGQEHSLLDPVAFPSYPRHARFETDLAIWLVKEVFEKL